MKESKCLVLQTSGAIGSKKAPNTAPQRDAVRVFKQFWWLEVNSGKMALSRPTPATNANY